MSNASVTFFSDGGSGTPSLFVQAANTWYDIRDTYVVRFVADGCRKNLPLCDYRVTFVDPQRIQTRDELIAFISDIVRDHKSNGSQWENGDVRSFLEAMASWLEDCDVYYGDQRDVGVADWQIFADALAAARIYE